MMDKSPEEWLDRIEDRRDYEKWYCGHYLTEQIDKTEIMFGSFDVFWLKMIFNKNE